MAACYNVVLPSLNITRLFINNYMPLYTNPCVGLQLHVGCTCRVYCSLVMSDRGLDCSFDFPFWALYEVACPPDVLSCTCNNCVVVGISDCHVFAVIATCQLTYTRHVHNTFDYI